MEAINKETKSVEKKIRFRTPAQVLFNTDNKIEDIVNREDVVDSQKRG